MFTWKKTTFLVGFFVASTLVSSTFAGDVWGTDEEKPMQEQEMMDTQTLESEALSVDIDIKPNDEFNEVKKEDGNLQVAILGSADFDVNQIDPSTITLAETESTGEFRLEDSNMDGFNDLVGEFPIAELQLDAGTNELTIKGKTKDGKSFEATDTIAFASEGMQPADELHQPGDEFQPLE